jgi:hypothetical protein
MLSPTRHEREQLQALLYIYVSQCFSSVAKALTHYGMEVLGERGDVAPTQS